MIGFGFEFQTNFKFSHHFFFCFFFHLKMCNWQMTISFTILTSMTEQHTHIHTTRHLIMVTSMCSLFLFLLLWPLLKLNDDEMRWDDENHAIDYLLWWWWWWYGQSSWSLITSHISSDNPSSSSTQNSVSSYSFIHSHNQSINQSIDWLFVWLTQWLRMHIKVILSYPSFTNFLCVCLYSFIHSFFLSTDENWIEMSLSLFVKF